MGTITLAEPAAYTYRMDDDNKMETAGTCPPNYATSHHTSTCILQQSGTQPSKEWTELTLQNKAVHALLPIHSPT